MRLTDQTEMNTLTFALLFGSFVSLVHCTTLSDEISIEARRCPKGKVFTECLPCAGRINCANPNPTICPLVCIAGCTCAKGTILNEKTGKCVKNCSASVPVRPPVRRCPRGFVFSQCLSCGSRPLTCSDKKNNTFCPLVCVPGCDCPRGKVLDQTTGKCVKKCPKRCPIKGQVFKRCVTCPWNPFTCANPIHPCVKICLPGCECPNGQVLSQNGKSCVPLEQCI